MAVSGAQTGLQIFGAAAGYRSQAKAYAENARLAAEAYGTELLDIDAATAGQQRQQIDQASDIAMAAERDASSARALIASTGLTGNTAQRLVAEQRAAVEESTGNLSNNLGELALQRTRERSGAYTRMQGRARGVAAPSRTALAINVGSAALGATSRDYDAYQRNRPSVTGSLKG